MNDEPLKESNSPELDSQTIRDRTVGFEQARLEHCIRLFNEENSRRDKFEKTAQYYLVFITAFLGALFLKLDFLQTVSHVLITRSPPFALVLLVYSSMAVMLLSILMGLICILECIRVRRYKREFPMNPALRLFANDSMYVGGENEASFLQITAMTYVATIEANFDITERKGLWIERASLFVLAAVLSLFILLTTITYLIVH